MIHDCRADVKRSVKQCTVKAGVEGLIDPCIVNGHLMSP